MTKREIRAALRAAAHAIRDGYQRRGAIPHDMAWPDAPRASRRRYLREARDVLRAAARAPHATD